MSRGGSAKTETKPLFHRLLSIRVSRADLISKLWAFLPLSGTCTPVGVSRDGGWNAHPRMEVSSFRPHGAYSVNSARVKQGKVMLDIWVRPSSAGDQLLLLSLAFCKSRVSEEVSPRHSPFTPGN